MATGTEIKTSIGHGLRGLTHLSGRDSRLLFWPYAIGVLLLYMFATLMAVVPIIFGTMARMQSLALEQPEDFVVRQQPGSYQITYVGDDPAIMAQILPDMTAFLTISIVGNFAFALLLVAATVRRLHDRSVSGKWLLVPAATASVSVALFVPMMLEIFEMPSDKAPTAALFGQFAAVFALNSIYLISMVLLLIQLVQASSPTPNRFGSNTSS